MDKYAIATFIVGSVEGFICYLIGYMVGITHDKRTITHECVKDAHDKTEPNSSEKPNNSKVSEKPTDSTRSKMEQVETMSCQECKHWNVYKGCRELVCKYEPKDEPQTERSE